jgi:hypothetical protein
VSQKKVWETNMNHVNNIGGKADFVQKKIVMQATCLDERTLRLRDQAADQRS